MLPNEFLTSLDSLANASGLAELQQHLGISGHALTPEEAENLRKTVLNVIRNSPKLKMEDVGVRVGPTGYGGAAAYPEAGYVSIRPGGVKDPALLAHELGHIESVRESEGGVYKPIQDASRSVFRGLTKGNRDIVIPALLGLGTLLLLKSNEAKRKALNVLTGVTAALTAPTLLEEVAATRKAMKNVPERVRDVRSLTSGIRNYAWEAAKPMAIFQLAKLFAR